MRGLFATATAVFQVALYKRVECKELVDPWDDDKTTVFNDPIHGHIELPRICVMIINTPEFLRLRHIKQLGATYEVFPGAAHNRFEHCLGVCHLAGTFGKHLQRQIDEALDKQKNNGEFEEQATDVTEKMKITEDDVKCLQIAGLCHDIGHGPMSHAFESHFIRKLDPFSKWKHEQGSLMMFEYLVHKNNIPIKQKDRVFIKQLIHRNKKSKQDTGRPEEKDFLYEIISNEENGIDVDKWDYFARDSYHLGFRNNFDHNRLIKFSRVINVEKKGWHICYRDKQVEDIYHMYMTRVILHRRACQHKTVQILERMYMEALEKANEHYRIKTPDGSEKKEWKISECIGNPEAFSKLTDHIFHDIRTSSDDELKDAREILKKIDTRKHYKLVSEALPKLDEEGLKLSYDCVRCDEEKILSEIVEHSKNNLTKGQDAVMKKAIECSKISLNQEEKQILQEIIKSSNGRLKEEDLLVDIAIYDFGRKEINPVDKVYFYNKTGKDQKYRAFHMEKEHISHLLPQVFAEHHIRLYIKNDDEKLMEEARKCFRAWCKQRNMNGKWKFQQSPKEE